MRGWVGVSHHGRGVLPLGPQSFVSAFSSPASQDQVMDSELVNRAEAIRVRLMQLRDSL